VKEIYTMGLKHGMRLAAISGVNGVYTNEDIKKVVELALAARTKAEQEILRPAKKRAVKADAGAVKKQASRAKAADNTAPAKAGPPRRRRKPATASEAPAKSP
jgi:hypothetical protein